MTVYTNQYIDEDTLAATTKTYTFEWKAKRIALTNDSLNADLGYKFNSTESYATLKGGETITIEQVSLRNFYLNSTASVAYRLWVNG